MKVGENIGYIVKQPNGLYCRFSTQMDCPAQWNMTEDDYINYRVELAKKDAKDTLENYLQPFISVVNDFIPDNNMSKDDFDKFLKEVGCNKDYYDLIGAWDD